MDMEVTAWMSLLPRDERAGGPAAVLQGDAAAHRRVRPAAPPAADVVPAAERRRRRSWRWRRRCWPAGSSTRSSRGADQTSCIGLAVLIAVIAVAEAGLGSGDALAVGEHRRGADPRPAYGGVRPRPADADRVLHPHPHRRAGQPAEQRRHRRAAGVQRHPVRRGRQPRHAGADAGRDARDLVADHAAGAGAAAGLRAAGPADGHPAGPAGARGGRTTTPR